MGKLTLYGFELKPALWGDGQTVHIKYSNDDYCQDEVGGIEAICREIEGGDDGERVWIQTGVQAFLEMPDGREKIEEFKAEFEALEWMEAELVEYYSRFIKIVD